MFGLDALWKFHVDVHFNRELVDHNKIALTKSPTKNDAEDDHKSDGKPCHNRCVSLEIVHSVDLLSAVEVQFVLCDLISLIVRSRLRCIDHTEGTIWMSPGTLLFFLSVQFLQSTCPLISLTTACTNSFASCCLSAC
jgi:hypothetical protein